MKLSNEMALIVRLTNTLRAALDDLRAAADNCEDPSLALSTVDDHTRMLNEAQHYINSKRPQVEGRVYLTDLDHIEEYCDAAAMMRVQHELAEAQEQYGKAITGVGLAKTIVDGLTTQRKMHLLHRNILLAIENGLDVQNSSLVMGRDSTGFYLYAKPATTDE